MQEPTQVYKSPDLDLLSLSSAARLKDRKLSAHGVYSLDANLEAQQDASNLDQVVVFWGGGRAFHCMLASHEAKKWVILWFPLSILKIKVNF